MKSKFKLLSLLQFYYRFALFSVIQIQTIRLYQRLQEYIKPIGKNIMNWHESGLESMLCDALQFVLSIRQLVTTATIATRMATE